MSVSTELLLLIHQSFTSAKCKKFLQYLDIMGFTFQLKQVDPNAVWPRTDCAL